MVYCAGKGGRWREAYEKNTENETDDPKKIPGRDYDFKGQLGVISDRNAAYFGGNLHLYIEYIEGEKFPKNKLYTRYTQEHGQLKLSKKGK